LNNPLDDLFGRRMIAVLGKGGVGRTSVSGALAIQATGRGLCTLVMETDRQTPLAAAFGQQTGFAPVRLADRLWGMFLGGQESLEDYLGKVVPRSMLRMVFASSLYQYFVQAAPALRELTMMGKIYNEIERPAPNQPRWDLIVFDAPASGQALSMLRMPFVARNTFAGSMVGREATEVARFFCDPKLCAMVAVTTAEPLAMAETLELSRTLDKLELETTALVFNQVSSATFDNGDIARMVRRGMRDPARDQIGRLAEIARAELKRRNRQNRALEILRRQIRAPILALRRRNGLAGISLLTELAGQLGAASDSSASSVSADP
jgi:anion-transporting  ArsA/GET3 family ATPase